MKESTNPLVAGTRVDSPDAPPPALLPYQQRWVADPSPLKVAEKSRRIGLTWGEAADDVLIAASAAGSNVFYISASQDMALEYVEACAMWARAFDLAAASIEDGIFIDDGDKEIKTYRIDFPKSGRRIVALSSRPANLRGKQGVVVIDEAAFAPDLSGLLKAAMAMLMWGDRVRILSTHNGEANPFQKLISDIRAGRRGGAVHRITFAEAVADGLFRRVCLRRGKPWTPEAEEAWVREVRGYYGDDAAEELDVIPDQGQGAWLSFDLIHSCETDMTYGGGNPPVFVGMDFAARGDLTVIAVLARVGDLLWLVELIELRETKFSEQLARLAEVFRDYRVVSAALDQTGLGEMPVQEAQRAHGETRVHGVIFTPAAKMEMATALKESMEDRKLRLPAGNRALVADLHAVRREVGATGIPRLVADRDAEGRADRFWALALAVTAARTANDGPYAYRAVPTGEEFRFADKGAW